MGAIAVFISVTKALSVSFPTLASDGVIVFTGASSSSPFVSFMGIAGEADDPEVISDCRLLVDVVTTGATETGLVGSPRPVKDELSALGIASVTEVVEG